MIIRNTIDEAKTGLNYVEFGDAYGYEVGVQSGGNVQASMPLWFLMVQGLTPMA